MSVQALQVVRYGSPPVGLEESSTASNLQEASNAPATAALDPSRATLTESASPAENVFGLPAAVAVMVGDAVVASKQPTAFGVPVLKPSAGAAAPSADHSRPGVVLEGCCWPACLIANKEQQVELWVEQRQQQCHGQQVPGCGKIMGVAQGVPGLCAADNDERRGRLIVFSDAGVLLDAPVAVGRVIR